ncbi:hypothetical protein Dimus_024467, partial [Dionaea muscipula]
PSCHTDPTFVIIIPHSSLLLDHTEEGEEGASARPRRRFTTKKAFPNHREKLPSPPSTQPHPPASLGHRRPPLPASLPIIDNREEDHHHRSSPILIASPTRCPRLPSTITFTPATTVTFADTDDV